MPEWVFRGWRRMVVGVSAMSLLVLGVIGAGAAEASTVHKNTDYYTASSMRFVSNLQACVSYSVSGKITYTSEKLANPTGPGNYYRIRKITFIAPKTTATMYRYDPGNHACTKKKLTLAKFKVSQAITGYDCSYNPQVSVSFPFSVGVGFWPSCKDRRAGRYSGAVSKKHTIIQSNQDSRIKFVDQVNTSAKPRCYGAAVNFKLTYGSTVATASSGWMKICLTPQY